jgi:cytochrome b involved in lipid metabolism
MFVPRSTSFGVRVVVGLRSNSVKEHSRHHRNGSFWVSSNANCKNNFRWMSSLSSQQQQQDGDPSFSTSSKVATAAALLAAAVTSGWTFSHSTANYTDCRATTRATTKPLPDESHWTPVRVSTETLQEIVDAHDVDKLPIYTSDQVAERNGEDGKPVWMSYGGVVYNVTDFVQNHPGGSNMIMMAAGSVRGKYILRLSSLDSTSGSCWKTCPKTQSLSLVTTYLNSFLFVLFARVCIASLHISLVKCTTAGHRTILAYLSSTFCLGFADSSHGTHGHWTSCR